MRVAYVSLLLALALLLLGVALRSGWGQAAYALPLLTGGLLFGWVGWRLRPGAAGRVEAAMASPDLTRRRRRLLFRLLAACAVAVGAELAAWVAFETGLWRFEVARSYLLGETAPRAFVALPALTYAPGPGYVEQGVVEHNAQGFRGPPVPLERTAGVRRILFLGGSTTYCVKVSPDQSYPAQVGALLRADLPAEWAGVEIINAGLPMGTSAELLTHYVFKYAYFEPDLVVIHTGGNDSLPGRPEFSPYYLPDYTHWRRNLRVPPELGPLGKLLARSRLLSLGLVVIMQGIDPGRRSLVRDVGPAPVPWHTGGFQERLFAFPRNLEALISEARRRGSRVLLVPHLPTPMPNHPLRESLARCDAALRDVAERLQVDVAPLPEGRIAAERFVDTSGHLDAEGCRQKAALVAPHVRRLLGAGE